VSASKNQAGKINVTLCNLNPNTVAELTCDLQGAKVSKISGRVLTAETMQTHNTFDKSDAVKSVEFSDFKPTASGFTAKLPAKSVVALTLE
jgi:alpha-N-arabinofuranosidase